MFLKKNTIYCFKYIIEFKLLSNFIMEESQYRFLLILFTLLNIINGLTVGFFDYLPLIWTNANPLVLLAFQPYPYIPLLLIHIYLRSLSLH